MRVDTIYLAGCASVLPARMEADEAVRQGLCEPSIPRETKITSVTVSDGASGPEMAAQAAREAIADSGCATSDVALVLHASLHYQGHDLWSSSAFVQREAVGSDCSAMDVGQMSNGGMAALELAVSWLMGRGGRPAALLTAGDRFCLPVVDRWRTDPGTVLADGGSALVLSRSGGFARLLCCVSTMDSELEFMHRGHDAFGEVPFSHRTPVDLGVPAKASTSDVGMKYILSRLAAGQREAITRALAEADLTLPKITWFVLPHLGWPRLRMAFFHPHGIEPERSTWSWARTVGHLGAGDQFAGLAHLRRSGLLKAGDICALLGVGTGFTWSCAIIEATGE
ncbi:ketoacyl-ACP synthase III family protein [Streptomyces solisilvae]|uniref:ketoacyl-ACP synthase III family protein n=1 Tax=Streptomyces malaysiensis TaxID=92644 RepID=UPI0036A0DA22